ncbi:hypothetical protein COO60DRAFT_613177 [Scenedesmus sp. NREL 46B-D3]|nr:hypothetical protein COO60DRAFT_613177 [Scenedesmus sp. NREL 46B-D3]
MTSYIRLLDVCTAAAGSISLCLLHFVVRASVHHVALATGYMRVQIRSTTCFVSTSDMCPEHCLPGTSGNALGVRHVRGHGTSMRTLAAHSQACEPGGGCGCCALAPHVRT